jgi:hypothetical protein
MRPRHAPVAHTYNPNSFGGRDGENPVSRPALAKKSY